MTVHIKICGITRPQDALLAEKLGASAAGFIFYPKSPRYIDPVDAGNIVSVLGPFMAKVGVFVDEDIDTVNGIIRAAGLTAVQLHGNESPRYCAGIEHAAVIKAFRVNKNFELHCLNEYQDYALLLDSFSKDAYGGTGTTFDWEIARKAVSIGRIILAGGLNESNVADAVRQVGPWGIDISSGIEILPGIKDHERMMALFKSLDSLNTEIDSN